MGFTLHHQNNPAASFDSSDESTATHSTASCPNPFQHHWLACEILLFHGDFIFSTSEHWKNLPARKIIPYVNLMMVVWNQLVNSGTGGMPSIKVWFRWYFISHLEGHQRFWEQGDGCTVCFKIVVFCAYQLSTVTDTFHYFSWEKKKGLKWDFNHFKYYRSSSEL